MIYADNAATTKISDNALEKMLPFLHEQYGNASSQYFLGTRAKRAIEQARQQVGTAIGAAPSEITFTSGGSEGNSWIIKAIADLFVNEPIHIITSSIEHHSVLNACRGFMGREAVVSYLPIDNYGCVSPKDLIATIRPNTKLVSVIMANNEIGTIQPIAEMAEILRKRNILFHTDAVQAVGHIPINIKELNVDFLTASAHKFNGPKGIGFAYMRHGVKLPSLVYGGGQEHGYRGGTENTAGIVALGYALEESVVEIDSISVRLSNLSKATIEGLKNSIPKIIINGQSGKQLPSIINVTFPDASGEAIMHLLDLKEICISTSSACHSGKDEPSHVLLALGLSEHQAKSSVRISYGRYNTLEEAEKIVTAISNAYLKIQQNKCR